MSFIYLVLITTSVCLMSDGSVAALCSTPYCPPPWRTYQGHCYQLVDIRKSWTDAERYCLMLSHPGKSVHIASINSKEEDDFIGEYLVNSSGITDDGYWIGYREYEREGLFQWADGSSASYENWHPAEPNNKYGTEDCVEKYKQYGLRTWNDIHCNWKRPFVCKM